MNSKYIFRHKYNNARFSCDAETDQEAIMTLGKLCQTVMDWTMRKYRPSKSKRKKLKKQNEKDYGKK